MRDILDAFDLEDLIIDWINLGGNCDITDDSIRANLVEYLIERI